MVAGGVALIKQAFPNHTPEQIADEFWPLQTIIGLQHQKYNFHNSRTKYYTWLS